MFVLVVVAPVTEEFIFRGIFLHRWAVKWGVIWSIILSSLLFGAIHRDIFWFSRAVGSVFIALYYIQTKTLLVPILMHAFNNGLVFIDLIFNLFNPSEVNHLNITAQYIWHGALNIMLAIPILLYFLKVPKSIKQFPYFRN
ncbi:MAG: lysostaphin resistance A-like protein [Pleurocapsa sp.]